MDAETLKADFALLDDWEDRYRYVIELGKALPPFPDALKTEATKVRGCASQVWIMVRTAGEAGSPPRLSIEGDSDALIVRGLIAILIAIYRDRTPAEVASFDIDGALKALRLKENLTPQRSNGLVAMIERIRSEARRLSATPPAMP